MVFVLSVTGNPLMPCSHTKARHLLKQRKARVVKRIPFTVQLTFSTTECVQPVILGVDAGFDTIGLSARTKDSVLFEANVKLRQDVVKLLSTRRESRRSRRNRKTRYRAARWQNRKRTAKWLAPSIRQRVLSHLSAVKFVAKVLPIAKIVVETASFDIQKIKDPAISAEQYQQGDQLGFWNIREYVLFRDNHTCQHCKGKSGDKVLNVHHLESRKTGGDRPDNLITLCETCHSDYHKGKITLKAKPQQGFKAETFMATTRWFVFNVLKEYFPNTEYTYGYLTKNTRIAAGLEKDHYIDARCIAGCPDAKVKNQPFELVKVRQHNRQTHKAVPNKQGKRQASQCAKTVFGFRLFDIVGFNGQLCYVHGKRSSGGFSVKTLNGEIVSPNMPCKKLTLIQHTQNFRIRRMCASSHD